MKIEGSIGDKGLMYVRDDIRRMLGKEIEMIANCKSVVIFPRGTDMKVLKQSLEIVMKDIDLTIQESSK